MNNNTFNPSNLTINKGDTVKFVNDDDVSHWPASSPHPTHTTYPEFDSSRPIAAGGSWSFTFTYVGAWSYHCHLHPSMSGFITVQ